MTCFVDRRIAADHARGVTTSPRNREQVAKICPCPECLARRARPAYVPSCPWLVVDDPEASMQASLTRLRRRWGHCWYCGAAFETAGDALRDLMTPWERGGLAWSGNQVACCASCNLQKRTKTVEEYRVVLAQRHHRPTVIFWAEWQQPATCPRSAHDGAVGLAEKLHGRFPCDDIGPSIAADRVGTCLESTVPDAVLRRARVAFPAFSCG